LPRHLQRRRADTLFRPGTDPYLSGSRPWPWIKPVRVDTDPVTRPLAAKAGGTGQAVIMMDLRAPTPECDHEQAVGPAPAGSASPGDHRRHRRDTMLLQATLQFDNGQSLRFRVRNISASGLLGEAPGAIAPGALVVVELRNVGHVPATVAWSLDGRFGLAFLDSIDPAVVRQIPAAAIPVGPIHTETADHVVRRPLVIGKQPPPEPVAAPIRRV
jgi:hypothetical protein